MLGKQAKILSTSDVSDLLIFATCTRHPLRNRVIVLLAAKAGLRAGEIASLVSAASADLAAALVMIGLLKRRRGLASPA